MRNNWLQYCAESDPDRPNLVMFLPSQANHLGKTSIPAEHACFPATLVSLPLSLEGFVYNPRPLSCH